MSKLIEAVRPLSRPYVYKRSSLTTTTKVYTSRYVCDVQSIAMLVDKVNQKLHEKNKNIDNHEFNFLISFTDNTHSDGNIEDLLSQSNLDTDKKTERIVLNWKVVCSDESGLHELEVTVRISNPINPLVFLQAALSKSPNEIDNVEFELGSTCVTVEGADQAYAEEVFFRITSWINARLKPRTYMDVGGFYKKYEWIIDQFIISIIPMLLVTIFSFYASQDLNIKTQLALMPTFIVTFFIFKSIGIKIANNMSGWAKRSNFIGLFSITQGDKDFLNEMMVNAKNGSLKIISALIITIVINISSGIACWFFIKSFLET